MLSGRFLGTARADAPRARPSAERRKERSPHDPPQRPGPHEDDCGRGRRDPRPGRVQAADHDQGVGPRRAESAGAVRSAGHRAGRRLLARLPSHQARPAQRRPDHVRVLGHQGGARPGRGGPARGDRQGRAGPAREEPQLRHLRLPQISRRQGRLVVTAVRVHPPEDPPGGRVHGHRHDRQPDQRVLLEHPRLPGHGHQAGRRERDRAGLQRGLRAPIHPSRRRPRPGLVPYRLTGAAARAHRRRAEEPAHLQRGDGRLRWRTRLSRRPDAASS